MQWWGLTGGIACGKTKVAEILRKRGFAVLDADHFVHQLMAPGQKGYEAVLQHFGAQVLNEKKEIDRQKLAEIVFSSPQKRIELEKLLHPLVRKRTLEKRESLREKGEKVVFYDVPLLFEKDLEDQFDRIIVVYCSPEQQRERLKKRNQLSDSEIELRLSSQWPMAEKVKKADISIDNSGSLKQLEGQIEEMIQKEIQPIFHS